MPGAVLAAGLTAAVAQAGAERRRSGAGAAPHPRRDPGPTGAAGAAGGRPGRRRSASLVRPARRLGDGRRPRSWLWDLVAAAVGLGRRRPRGRRSGGPRRPCPGRRPGGPPPRARAGRAWLRFGLDLLLIAAGLVVFWASGQNKYTLVLAPEGVPTISVSYWAFLGPTLAWVGCGLLCWRVADAVLAARRPARRGRGPARPRLARARRRVDARAAAPGRRALDRAARPRPRLRLLDRHLQRDVPTAGRGRRSAHQRRRRHGHRTGRSQRAPVVRRPARRRPRRPRGRADAAPVRLRRQRPPGPLRHRLVEPDPGHPPPGLLLPAGDRRPGARRVCRPDRTASWSAPRPSTTSSSARATSSGCGCRTRGPTGTSSCRSTTSASSTSSRPRPRTASSSPTPTTSHEQTHSDAVGTFLVDTGGHDIAGVADRVSAVVGTTGQVGTLIDARGLVGSSLTSVDLSRLTRLELAFALRDRRRGRRPGPRARPRRAPARARAGHLAGRQRAADPPPRGRGAGVRAGRRHRLRTGCRLGAVVPDRQGPHRCLRPAADLAGGAVDLRRRRGRGGRRLGARRRPSWSRGRPASRARDLLRAT